MFVLFFILHGKTKILKSAKSHNENDQNTKNEMSQTLQIRNESKWAIFWTNEKIPYFQEPLYARLDIYTEDLALL